MKKILVIILSVALSISFLSGCSNNADSGSGSENEYDKVNLKLSCNGTEIANDTKTAQLFAEMIEEKSGGNVIVSVFPNDQLASGNMSKGLEMLCDGTVDLDCHSTSIIANLDNRLMVSTLPWTFSDYQEAEDVFFGTGGEYIDSVVKEKGLTYLGSVHNGFKAMTCSKRLIKTPEDLNGLKMRIPGGDFFSAFYSEFGASPQAMSWAEVFTALQQGTIDGHDNSLSTINSSNVQEVQKYITISKHTYEAFTFLANEESFSRLNVATQELVKECIEESCKQMNQEIADGEEELKNKFADESGCEIYEFTEEDIQSFSEVITDLMEEYKGIYGEEACKAFGIE
ncbi:MAG: DctP family TRAP transporter solute-binding subunit [Lachnospiraceae bacterium]